jgi:hypothetical protein
LSTTTSRQNRVAGRRVVAALLGLALGGAAIVALGGSPAVADDCTANIDYSTAGTYCFRVPTGVQRVKFDVSGAQGGRGGTHGAGGGLGGQVIDDVAVTPGQTFMITVGGAGADGSDAQGGGSGWAAGGFNGGGRGGGSNGTSPSSGGGGGGASDIRTADGTKIIVAAGGGGGGGWGGWSLFGDDSGNSGGGGGDNVADGTGEHGVTLDPGPGGYDGYAGSGGGPTSGGHGPARDSLGDLGPDAGPGQGNDGQCIQAIVCSLGLDGVLETGGGGGGGGGGWYGGGGGSAGTGAWQIGDGGGGAGGSSHASATATYRRGVNSGNGRVRLSYFTTVVVTSATNPSTSDQQVAFTARISPTPNGGSVTFTMDGYAMCPTAVPAVNGTATCGQLPNTYYTVGTHEVRATYSGAAGSTPASSAVMSQIVLAHTALTLKIAELGDRTDDVATGQNQDITLIATATAVGAPIQQPLGPITFYDGTSKLATVLPRMTGNGQSEATMHGFNFLTPGINQLRAEYAATTTTTPASSAVVNHAVHRGITQYADNSTTLKYVGSGWGYYPDRPFGDYMADVHATTQTGDYVTYTATGGRRVSLYGERDPQQGTIGIYWGDQLLATVDTSGPISNQSRQVIWSAQLPGNSSTSKPLKVANLTQGKWFTVDQITDDPGF